MSAERDRQKVATTAPSALDAGIDSWTQMMTSLAYGVTALLCKLSGIDAFPPWLCVLTFLVLCLVLGLFYALLSVFGLGLFYALLSVFGLPKSWKSMLLEDFIVLEKDLLSRFLEFWLPPLPDVLFPETCRKCRGSMPYKLEKILLTESPSVFEPPALQQENAREGCSGEAWFFINGIGHNREMTQNLGEALFKIFGRPITCIFNPTDSILFDFVECLLGRFCYRFKTEERKWAFDVVRKALLEQSKQKVVVIAHSQGTIIISNVLHDLNEESANNAQLAAAMSKLEVYAFANCSQQLIVGKANHVESICNEWDIVAMFGALAPSNVKDAYGRNIVIEGSVVKESSKYGHCLISHYLNGFAAGQYKGSRLHDYKHAK